MFSLSLPIEQPLIPSPVTSTYSNLTIKNHLILVWWAATSVNIQQLLGSSIFLIFAFCFLSFNYYCGSGDVPKALCFVSVKVLNKGLVWRRCHCPGEIRWCLLHGCAAALGLGMAQELVSFWGAGFHSGLLPGAELFQVGQETRTRMGHPPVLGSWCVLPSPDSSWEQPECGGRRGSTASSPHHTRCASSRHPLEALAAWQEIQRGRAGDQVPHPRLPHSNGEVVVLVQVVFLLSPTPGTSSSGRAPLERGGTSSRLALGWPGLTRGSFPDSVHRRGEFGCSLAAGKAGWASTPPSCTVSSLSLGRVSAGGVLGDLGDRRGGRRRGEFEV